MTGTSPLIEIFSNRLEITNPGVPLIDKSRFIDHPPVSRNEKLASFIKKSSKPIIIASFSEGSTEHIVKAVSQFGVSLKRSDIWENARKKTPSIIQMPLEKGFTCSDFMVLTEEDILGERMVRPSRYRKAKENFIEDYTKGQDLKEYIEYVEYMFDEERKVSTLVYIPIELLKKQLNSLEILKY